MSVSEGLELHTARACLEVRTKFDGTSSTAKGAPGVSRHVPHDGKYVAALGLTIQRQRGMHRCDVEWHHEELQYG